MGNHYTFRPRPNILILARRLDPCQCVILCGIYGFPDASRKIQVEQYAISWHNPVFLRFQSGSHVRMSHSDMSVSLCDRARFPTGFNPVYMSACHNVTWRCRILTCHNLTPVSYPDICIRFSTGLNPDFPMFLSGFDMSYVDI